MTQLQGCIHHWNQVIHDSKALLSPSTLVIIEATIRYLEELKKLKGELK